MGRRICRTAALIAAIATVGGGMAAGASAATHTRSFRPRIGRALGLVPARGHFDLASGRNIPAVYHGGTVMGGTVTVHTVFWAPPGYRFDGSPGPGVLGYVPLVQQFLGDVAHDSGATGNVFGVLDQYGQNSGPGGYSIAYSPATDSIADSDPYPRSSDQCPSPAGTVTCVTDPQIISELRHVIRRTDPSAVGLHDIWEIYLPPGVDECITAGSCGTDAYAGYHSLASIGQGEFVYAVMIDPLIEGPPTQGFDPQGNPEAEETIDTAAHETVEAITDPEGIGWMDPNGYEVGDKCESGPQVGTPIGYAPDGSPYDQVIDGHEYAIQTMWSNAASGCVQSSSSTADGLPLPVVRLRQFSPAITGDIGRGRAGVSVEVALQRAGELVATGATTTRADGSWGPLVLRGRHGAIHGVGDDRDELFVDYGRGGPPLDLIATGAGGDPFSEAGWTTWLDLDEGFFIGRSSVTLLPCGQTGVLRVHVDGRPTASPLPFCQNQTDAATVSTGPLGRSTRVVISSLDNRAVSAAAPAGALVSLTIAPGEPGSVSQFSPPGLPLPTGGLPQCSVELRRQAATCAGLIPDARYRLRRRRGGAERTARADSSGIARFTSFPGSAGLRGGDVLTLSGSAGRVLTVLHVAHLRVAIDGAQTLLSGGRCDPGEYYGAPLTREPASDQVGDPGAAGLGVICPADGHARGLSTRAIAQTDDRSGGITWTSLPELTGEAPGNDAIVTGPFTALAQTGITGAHGAVYGTGCTVSLTIASGASGGHVVFRAADVSRGARVPALASGIYHATWVVRDINGDTRTVVTHFVEN